MGTPSIRSSLVRVAVVAVACVAPGGIAEAWPVRGPVARAERRVFRAQMALERELARPLGRVRVIEVPVYPVQPGGIPGAGPEVILPAEAVSSPGQPPAPAPLATRAADRPIGGIPAPRVAPGAAASTGVAPAAFETAAPARSPAGPSPASAANPAADGTVSVLVRPEAAAAGSQPAQEPAAEPLLLPGPSQP